MSTSAASQRSLAAALKQVLNQVGRMLEEEDPRFVFAEGGSLPVTLAAWRQTVTDQTRPADRDRERRLENEKLEMMGQNAMLQKECSDLRARNSDLLNQVVKLNEREKELRQEVLNVQFQRGGVSAENKALDLEIRDLRRRIRELEGGPALTPAEAAPILRQAALPTTTPPQASEAKRPRRARPKPAADGMPARSRAAAKTPAQKRTPAQPAQKKRAKAAPPATASAKTTPQAERPRNAKKEKQEKKERSAPQTPRPAAPAAKKKTAAKRKTAPARRDAATAPPKQRTTKRRPAR